ncbi:unnamed protein product, partial [Prorocentrum cordatum]
CPRRGPAESDGGLQAGVPRQQRGQPPGQPLRGLPHRGQEEQRRRDALRQRPEDAAAGHPPGQGRPGREGPRARGQRPRGQRAAEQQATASAARRWRLPLAKEACVIDAVEL